MAQSLTTMTHVEIEGDGHNHQSFAWKEVAIGKANAAYEIHRSFRNVRPMQEDMASSEETVNTT